MRIGLLWVVCGGVEWGSYFVSMDKWLRFMQLHSGRLQLDSRPGLTAGPESDVGSAIPITEVNPIMHRKSRA